MKYLSDVEIKNQRVLLRCDFNVPIKDGNICDDSKIIKSLDTIKYLLDQKNIVIILSHFGRVKTEEDKNNNSLYEVYEYMKKYIDLEFIKDPLNLDIINNSNKKCFLVENTRFTDVPEKRESKNDLELAKYWANFGDVFVVDAFASLHRAHSSTAGISKYLPSYLGFLVEHEIKNLEPLIKNPNHPFLVVMGGAKVDDKISIIEGLLKKCDNLILTGGILNTFLKVKGYNIGKSLVSEDDEVIKSVKDILNEYENKIIYSDIFIVNRNEEILKIKLNDIKDEDIIYDNIITKDEYINNAKIIFFNGTCGKFEDEKYSLGTKKLLNDLSKSDASVFIGGGDTASAVNNLGYSDLFTYVSSGGGATLEYIAYDNLKALDFIEKESVEN